MKTRPRFIPRRALCVLAAICAVPVMASVSHAGPASDTAANAAYADGWQSGDNGGTGFMPWELLYSGVTNTLQQPGPHFIDTAPALPANTLGAPAFGLTTSARPLFDDTSEAHRRLSVPLAVGETFLLDVDGSALNGNVAQFTAGNVIQLLSGNDMERFGIFTNNGFEGNNWVTFADRSTGLPAASAFQFEFTLRTPDRFDFVMRPLGGGDPLFSQINAPLGGSSGSAIDRLAIATYGNGSSADGTLELFFNNLQITRLPSVWNVDTNGNWGNGANWTGIIPNAAGAVAVFGNKITAPRTATVNVAATVGRIEFDNANAYRISGSNTLSLDATAGSASIEVISGSHQVSAPVALVDDTVVTVSAGNSLSVIGAVSGAGAALTKAGAGTLTVNNLVVASLAVDNGTVALQSGGGTPVLGSLSIAGASTAPTATLDVNNSGLVVDYPVAEPGPDATIRDQIIAGRGGPGLGKTWNGNGITSSQAAADPVNVGSVGYAVNGTMPLGALPSFRGHSVDASAVLLRYTRTGDANLDGVVNNSDVAIVGANYAPGSPKPRWDLGDFDYNGFVDNGDITLLGAFYNPMATPIPAPAESSGIVAVPEPNTCWLLVCSGIFVLARVSLQRRQCR
jgi:hypothetical protein